MPRSDAAHSAGLPPVLRKLLGDLSSFEAGLLDGITVAGTRVPSKALTVDAQGALDALTITALTAKSQGITVCNKSGGDFAKGTLLYVSGYDTTLACPIVSKADADGGAGVAQFVAPAIIANNASGLAYTIGTVTGIDTSGAGAVGSLAYLSGTAGEFAWAALTGADQVSQIVGVCLTKHATTGSMVFVPGLRPVLKIGTGGIQNAAVALANLSVAVQASLALADSAYQKPGLGIPASDTATAVQTALTKAGTALQFANASQGYGANVVLSGANPTVVTFVPPATAATLLGTDVAATKALAPGNTFIVNPDGAGDETWTVAGTKATSVSDAAPSTDMTQVETPGTSVSDAAPSEDMTTYATAGTSVGAAGASEDMTQVATAGVSTSAASASQDMSASTDVNAKIAANGGAATPVTFDWTAGGGCNTGAKIAAEMQTKIQALGGDFATFTVDWNVTAANRYTITSGATGSTSAVAVTAGTTDSCTGPLNLGVAEGGTETAGVNAAGTKLKVAADGGVATEVTANWAGCNSGAAIATQLQTIIQALGGAFAAVTVAWGVAYTITSGTKGTASAITVTPGTTVDAAAALKLGAANAGTETPGTDAKTLQIAANGGVASPVTFDWTADGGSDSGVKIAAEMQTKIQALGGAFAAVTVGFGAGIYTITSGTTGTPSAIVITNGSTSNCAAALKLGAANGGVETPGVDAAGTKLKVSVDGAAATEVTANWAGCNSGGAIATQLQSIIQALGGAFAAATVGYGAGVYTVTSGTYGTASAVAITPGTTVDAAAALKLGTANSGVETPGTGDAANLAAATPAECAAKLAALTGLTATVVGNAVRITSDTTGTTSSLVVNAASTLDTVLGITGSAYGSGTFGAIPIMANATYAVTITNLTAACYDGYNVARYTDRVEINCETPASVNTVSVTVVGTPA